MQKEKASEKIYYVFRVLSIVAFVLLFVPGLNPARISELISKTTSVFTCGTGYGTLISTFTRAINKGWIGTVTLQAVFAGSLCIIIGFAGAALASCFSLGNNKLQRLGLWFSTVGGTLAAIGSAVLIWAASDIQGTPKPNKVKPLTQECVYLFLAISILLILFSVIQFFLVPKAKKEEAFHMESKYKLFLLFLPFLAVCFIFSYLPLYGWRYAFFNYKAGNTLTFDDFVGFKWFTFLFENEATRSDLVRVMRNTLAMSGLGLLTSWCSMAFAIFLCEIKNLKFRRFVQVFTTIPNFISWVLVYAVAFAIFSTDGFVSSLLIKSGLADNGINFLMNNSHMWLKMLAWGMWKGLGWSAIIYIAAISGIDQQLYEAATVDGAGRFQRMWNITVPCLIPTFMVLLLLAIAGILNNGLDQYLVFENAYNTNTTTVLDLYVYKLGINKGKIPLATVIGMFKSLISVVLLFGANKVSKLTRGESII